MTATPTSVVPTAVGSRGAGRAGGGRDRRRLSAFKVLSLLPLILVLVLLVGFPIGQMVWMSFGDVRLSAGDLVWDFTGLANYQRMLEDETFRVSLWNSLVFIFFTVLITVVLGVALALAADRLVRGQRLIQNVLLWPAIVAPVVISVAWLLILSPQVGLLNKILTSVGASPQTWLGEPVGAMASVIVVDVWHWTPIVFLLIYTALRSLDSSVLEAASIDGASYLATVRYIVLPLLTPAILGAVAIRVLMGVKVFDEMYLLTFGGPGTATTVISIYLRSVFFESFQYGFGSALSVTVVVLVLVTLLAVLLVRRVVRGVRHA
ncbi:carbohydrate ABC transporter permease [Quadrisphaera sp. GCM10027208]|uniref:carbohydrate ABC transporter permease n=1 Tax=Quadrisphaera sp. GCM10027208 TaxID=3273423 RepID=UPI00361B53D3